MKIKTNERELTQKITQWLDEIIKRGSFPFKEATGETGIQVDTSTYFADVVIWRNRSTSEAFSYLELKPPGGKENLERFKKKANSLKVKYAFTWDFQDLKTYKIVGTRIELCDTETIQILSNIEEWKRGDKQSLIKISLRKLCDNLLHLHETGKPHKFLPDKVFFVNLIRNTTEKLITIFESFIQHAQHKKIFKETIRQYARVQGIPVTEDYTKVLTNHVVYGLITKVIFYLTIRRYFTDLPSLDDIGEKDLSKTIRIAFSKAREKDWQAVFEEDPIEQLGIPADAYPIIYDFFSELRAYHFGELPEDVIGQLFEDIIDPEKRHNLGQYFTREDLVDLVIATVVNEPNGVYCDPTCGSGTFLVRLYDRLKYLSQNRGTHKDRLNQIWGFDVGKFPAELSTINLFRQDVGDLDNFPRIRKTDIFDVRKGDTFDFPPSYAGASGVRVQLQLPEFDALVGNFPFIRQELIEKEFKGYKNQLTALLGEEYFSTYSKLFNLKGIKPSHINSPQTIQRAVEKGWLDLTLSGQADIYAYIFLHTATFLKSDGSFAIITSNSWLDVSYGAVLKQFFVDHFKIKMIIASWAEPWFEEAAVNTVVTVLEKESDVKKRSDNNVHFVKLKKKLSDIIPYDLKFQSTQRWQKLDSLVNLIEESKYQKECKEVAENISTFENDELRVRIVQQINLTRELNEKSDLAKWGKYLRAPDVYFEILENCKNKLVPLKEIADVRFGIKTGINDFFYLTPVEGKTKKGFVKCKNARGWDGEIEEIYLKMVIKDSSQFPKILIEKEDIKDLIFICNKSKSELKKLGHIGALKYIEWGEKQVNSDKVKFPDIKSVSSRKYWYGINNVIDDEIVYLAAPRNRFLTFHNKSKFCLDKRLYSVKPKNKNVLLILNSFLNQMHLEAYGRDVNNGNAKEFTVEDVENMLVPNTKIKFNVSQLSKRIIKPIFEEVKRNDRQSLDIAVLKSLGLDPDKYLDKIYDGLCEMVRERLELPKMRKKQQKETVKLALDQIKKSVVEECIPNGPKRFPEEFYGCDVDEIKFDRYPTSGLPLSYQHFFGNYEIRDTNGKVILTTDSEYKANFALLLAKPDISILKIPKDEKIVKKAITAYHKYEKNLFEELSANAIHKAHDWSIAERLAKEIMEEWGIRGL